MSRSRDLEQVHGSILNAFHLVLVSQAARSPRFQPNDGVMRQKLRWPLVLMVFVHCLWVLKEREDRCVEKRKAIIL